MVIKILGSGCRNCNILEKNVIDTLAKHNIAASVEHIQDIEVIIGYGVMSTPALVIDEKVVSTGKVLKEKELLKFFKPE
ncbi:MAG: thioredoxin family protein [Candidatus Cloacimonetes bacterium]|nr:thioredoxin family protein [Candidatus Cloacimonadota bacterium]